MNTLYQGINYKVTHEGKQDVWHRTKDNTIFGVKPCQCKEIKKAGVKTPMTYTAKKHFLGHIQNRQVEVK